MMDFATLKKFEKNQEIVVTTAKGKFYGKFNKLAFNESRLDILDVKGENGRSCGAFKYFFKKDVISVSIVGEELKENEAEAELPNIETQTPLLTPQQRQSVTQSINSFTYIQQADTKYFEAIEDISKQFVIGIFGDCCRGRIYNINLLSISTADRVYIFDLPALKTEKTISELKTILNSDSHLKIVYDSQNIVDNFKAKFGFELKPVFDVMLSAAQFHQKKDVLELGNCVKSVLGIEVDITNDEVIKERPLSPNLLLAFANKSGFLLPIYHKLSAKSFSIMFQNNLDNSEGDTETFFDGLGLTKVEKLENQSQLLQLQEIDFSIYKSRD